MKPDLARIYDLMRTAGIDVLVASGPDNASHLAGYPVRSRIYLPRRIAFVMLPLDAEADTVMVPAGWEARDAEGQSWITDLRPYRLFVQEPIRLLVEALEEKGLDKSRIGVEYEFLPAIDFATLHELLPHAELVAADGVMARARAIKTQEEINILRTAAEITDRALRTAMESARVGDTERSLFRVFSDEAIRMGADLVKAIQIGAGERASFVWGCYPSDRRLQPGDIVRLDVILDVRGYMSDMQRTACVGPPSVRQRELYDTMWRGVAAAQHIVRPGVTASEVHGAAAAIFEDAGIPFPAKDVGHGLGLKLHEAPILRPGNLDVLEEGMVLTVETALLADGMGVEDMVVVTADGHEKLTNRWEHGTIFEMPAQPSAIDWHATMALGPVGSDLDLAITRE